MNIRQLRTFAAIMDEGSLSAAAQRLGVTQPSVSQQLRQLELESGLALFVRTYSGVVPTQAAEVLLGHARRILAAIDAASEEIREMRSAPEGAVAIGLPSSVSMVLSVPLAETVRHELPGVTLRVVEAMSGHVQQWLADGAVDLGVIYTDAVKGLVARPLVLESLYFVSAPDNAPEDTMVDESGESVISLGAVTKMPLILPGRTHGLRALVDRHARDSGLDLKVVIEMDALAQIKALVSRGSGHAILAHPATYNEVQRGELVMFRICPPELQRTSYLVRNSERRVTRAISEVERIIVEIMAELILKKRLRGKLVDPAKAHPA